MKFMLVLWVALMSAVALRAEGDFTKTMTPEEIAATGLSKLSPEELARLKAVIERYRSGEVAVVEKKAEQQVAAVKQEAEQKVTATKHEADTKVAAVQKEAEAKVTTAKQEAETKVAAADARAKDAETKAKATATVTTTAAATASTGATATGSAATEKKKHPSWMSALITLDKTGKKPDDAEAMETKLAGKLSSFKGARRFELQNGQIWEMIEPSSYSGPTLISPVVTIRPGTFGTFWLKIPDAALRVKVKPVKLE